MEWNRGGRFWFFNGKLLGAVMIHDTSPGHNPLARGVPALTHGPLARGAHTPRETVSLDDLVRVARVYVLTAVAYC